MEKRAKAPRKPARPKLVPRLEVVTLAPISPRLARATEAQRRTLELLDTESLKEALGSCRKASYEANDIIEKHMWLDAAMSIVLGDVTKARLLVESTTKLHT